MQLDIFDVIAKKINRISDSIKWAFFTALIVGIICHIMSWVNLLINHDSLLYLSWDGSYLATQGKWLFASLLKLRGTLTCTSINTPIALLELSLVAALTTYILNIGNKYNAAIIGAFIVSFPSVFSTFTYNMQDVFFSSLLLATFSVFCSKCIKYGNIIALFVLGLSLSIYQAYIGYAVGLFILLCILDIYEEKDFKVIIENGLKYIFVIIGAVVLYYISLKVYLTINNMSLGDYRNINNMEKIQWETIPKLIAQSYKSFFDFFVNDFFGTGEMALKIGYRLVIILNFILSGALMVIRKVYKDKKKLILNIILLVFILPLGVHSIAILGQEASTHWIMKYAFIILFINMIKLLDLCIHYINDENKVSKSTLKNVISCLNYVIVILSIVIVSRWFILSNQAYKCLQISYENAYAKSIILAESIIDNENYTKSTPVVFVGDEKPYSFFIDSNTAYDKLFKFTGVVDSSGMLYYPYQIYYMMRDYIGINFLGVDSDAELRIKNNEFVKSMNVFPEYNSIAFVDGVIVVKLSN